MKFLRFVSSAFVLSSAIFIWSAAVASAQEEKSSQTSKPLIAAAENSKAEAIDFNFVDFTGKPRNFSEFRGKVVLLDFWATWCAPCLADIPKLKAVYEKYKADGFEIVGLNVETIGDDAPIDAKAARESAAHAKQIVTTRKVSWTVATSQTAVPVATKIFGVESLPSKILIDRDGKIIAVIGEKDDLAAIVEKLLSSDKQEK